VSIANTFPNIKIIIFKVLTIPLYDLFNINILKLINQNQNQNEISIPKPSLEFKHKKLSVNNY
jgi:hypothetical protein